MKNFILIILMVITIFLSGCNNENITDKKDNDEKEETVEKEPTVEIDGEKDPNVGTNEVNFYLFYLSTCGHCHSEREWISSIEDEYPYVNFKMYEVTENEELFNTINQAFGTDNDAFPVTIIGNNYMVGYSDTKNRKFIRYMEELSTFENCDVVQTAIDGKNVEACMKQNEQ